MHPHSLLSILALVTSVALAPAHAAGVTVTVTDKGGQVVTGAAVLLEPASGRAGVKPLAPVEVSQTKRQFNPRVTILTVGTAVNFPNFDTVRHHVFSDSPTKKFDIKLYAGTPAKPVVFDKAGIVDMGCNIHDAMAAWIVVSDTPWYGVSGNDGTVAIDNLPAGNYRLRVWHPAMDYNTEMPAVPVTLGASDLKLGSRLPVSTSP
jgi:plastocyanin